MHRTRRYCLAALVVALLPLAAVAQPKISLVRIGLPSSGKSSDESGRSRSSAWAPVAVVLESGDADVPRGTYRLRIETTDLEEQVYQYTVAVPAIGAKAPATVLGYTMPGSDSAIFKVQLETLDGRTVGVRDKIT